MSDHDQNRLRRISACILVTIEQAVWLYARFTLSFRDVEDLLAERGIMVFYLWRAVDAEGEVLDVLGAEQAQASGTKIDAEIAQENGLCSR